LSALDWFVMTRKKKTAASSHVSGSNIRASTSSSSSASGPAGSAWLWLWLAATYLQWGGASSYVSK
jgi:hypothetical protein